LIPISRELIYYKDAECTKIFPYEGDNQKIVNEDAIRQGESGSLTVYLRNESKHDYEIKEVFLGDKYLSIELSNRKITSGNVITVTLTWTVPDTLEKPLRVSFAFDGEFIVRE